jgi:hypothetical protein
LVKLGLLRSFASFVEVQGWLEDAYTATTNIICEHGVGRVACGDAEFQAATCLA